MGCGEFLVKYILFFANLFFALAGLTLVGLGVAVQLQVKTVVDIADGTFQVAPITAMVVGSIVFLIAFFGCCGAIREDNCMLVTYSIFMIILMIIKIALATLIFVKMDALLKEISKWLSQTFSSNPNAFHEIEQTFQCCGLQGPQSYINVLLPTSCCENNQNPCLITSAYTTGCSTIVEEFFKTFGTAIASVAIVVSAIELVAVVFALCLANHARNNERRRAY